MTRKPIIEHDFTQREVDTILAALRLWQHFLNGSAPDAIGLWEIARNDRGKEPEAALSVAEIDALIDALIEDRLNV